MAVRGLTALTDASPGLDRAFNILSAAHDPDGGLADRDLIPKTTRVKMHCNPVAARMEFSLGREPKSEAC